MKILIYGPKEPLGGIETVVLEYARELILLGCQCDFLLYDKYPILEKKIKEINGNTVYAASRRGNYSQYKKDINRILSENKYDAVWCNYSGLTNIDLLKIAKKTGIAKRIVHSHVSALSWGSSLMKILVHLLHYKNKLKIGKYATDFWACSKMAGQFMYPKKLWEKVHICNNAIRIDILKPDSIKRDECRKKLGFENCTVVGHIGRICREKNQFFLLNVFDKFQAQNDNARLLFLSDDSNGEIVALAKELGLYEKAVFLTGNQDLPLLYNAMDVFFLPSLSEGLGLTLIEAQSCGVPCLASANVPKEADLTGCVKFLPLDSSVENWCDELKNMSSKRIENPSEFISRSDYDIVSESKKLFDFFNS